MPDKYQVLQSTSLGARIAEQEDDALSRYFVETEQWRELYAGNVDIVYGPKGSGKSALYTLLVARAQKLREKGVIVLPAEKVRGQTVFGGLVSDPPTSEREMVGIWKTYILLLITDSLRNYRESSPQVRDLLQALAEADLMPPTFNLKNALRSTVEFVRRFTRPSAYEGGVVFDPATQLPVGITGKITLSDATTEQQRHGVQSVDDLLAIANECAEELDLDYWLAIDRLDIAFTESEEVETNALRALFRVYLDIEDLGRVNLKIFLRDDIWARITESGFRESSHIVRYVTISWDARGLMNLIVRRFISNPGICEYYSVDPEEVMSSTDWQESLFYKIFPDQVDVGERRPTTFKWLLSRTRDGIGKNAPRELIHLVTEIRTEQIRQLELGEAEPSSDQLFSSSAIKPALVPVSKAKLEQTLYAEYPQYKEYIEGLRGEKSEHTIDTLMELWGVDEDEAVNLASSLAGVGFFEIRGDKYEQNFWVPFVFRDSLELIQGKADI